MLFYQRRGQNKDSLLLLGISECYERAVGKIRLVNYSMLPVTA